MNPIRLTQLSHKGGCGCKIAPTLLQEMLSSSTDFPFPKELLVGKETSDDAAVYQINESQAIVATTDFFMPIVDDPFDFGQIAATNAISDIYAMGGRPLFALAIVGMPVNTLTPDLIRKILEGGESACNKAGLVIAGGHTIDSQEPIYGLCVIGMVDPRHLKRNVGAQDGDLIVLGKPLGIGIYCSAVKKEKLPQEDYEELLGIMTKVNCVGSSLGQIDGVHALTDVTGFGLLGHLSEITLGSKIGAKLYFENIPRLPKAQALHAQGFVTGASKTNWNAYSGNLKNSETLTIFQKDLLTDPQTSGGLLLACAPDTLDTVLEIFHSRNITPSVIGCFSKNLTQIEVLQGPVS